MMLWQFFIEMITSRQNPLIKKIKSLENKKDRDELNLFVVEGLKSVKEVTASKLTVEMLVFTQSGKALFGDTGLPFEVVSDSVFQCISGEKTPQGVLAVCQKRDVKLYTSNGVALLLDEVGDPANVGAVIRTAAACGYNDVFLINSADPYSPKAVRTSMGGLFKVNLHCGNKETILNKISKPLVVADMCGENVFDTEIKGDFCLVVGNEGHGLDKEIKNKAKYTVGIPMQNDMESLNVAVSAGIIMYALNKQIKGES